MFEFLKCFNSDMNFPTNSSVKTGTLKTSEPTFS
eukprot:14867.XXX_979538_979639_1 [CDS] Oithona nana genome sequencing.